MSYGVANVAGQPDTTTATKIVSGAWSCGVRFFDTAQAYGTSEMTLGQAFADLSIAGEARVVTKLKAASGDGDVSTILRSVEASLKRLHVRHLWGILLHSEEQLDYWNGALGKTLRQAKHSKLVSRIGVSVYSPSRALQALQMDDLDVIQVPANLFDRRMERAGVFERARELNKTVFVRSVYLQGLALISCDLAPKRIPGAREAVGALRRFCAEHRLNRRQFAIDYVRLMVPAARLVIGAETPRQVLENCGFFQKEPIDRGIMQAWTSQWPEDIDALIDPRTWPVLARNDSVRQP
jgi:aryl-alcohol dehydrogenase-like predicted oxidoreductase